MKKTKWVVAYIGAILFVVVTLVACSGDTKLVNLYDGESFVKAVSVTVNQEYNLGVANKTGYTFVGWYSEADGGIAYTDSQGKSAGMTWKPEYALNAYAHWEANQYEISLDYCGATAINSITNISATYDKTITDRLPVPERRGYSFAGWFTEKNGGMQVADAAGNFMPGFEVFSEDTYEIDQGEIVLYAHWGERMVTYTFSTEDGTHVADVSYPIGTTLYDLPASIKDNHCFVSWCFDQTLLQEMTFPYTISETTESVVILYANFIPGTIDVLQFSAISSTGDREYEVTYTGDAEEIIIPDSYYGKKVTRIRKISSSTLRKITLPQTIKELSNGAFENCVALESINIPFAVEELPERCFAECGALKEINIPQSVSTIGKEAFSGCASIERLILPQGVATVQAGAFRNMSSLYAFEVDEQNTRYIVKDGVLYYKVGTSLYLVQYPAAKQATTYTIDPATVKIMKYAFSSSQISSIIIGGKISSVEEGAFENCANLVSVSITGAAVSFAIEDKAFANCYNLKAVKIELTKVPSLNATAFEGVSDTFSVYVTSDMIRNYQTATNWRAISEHIYSLGTIFGSFAVEEVDGGYAIRQYFGTEKEVVIPEILNTKRIVKISENAFSFANIEKITISKYIREIEDHAFKNCTVLSVIILECEPPALGERVFENIAPDFGIYIKNTPEILDAYRKAKGWKQFAENIWSYQ